MRHVRLTACLSAVIVLGVGLSVGDAGAVFPAKSGLIVFNSDRTGNNEIFSMAENGTDVRQLTHDPGNDTFPAWSPDGRKIAFTSTRDGNREIYVMDVDGSNQTRVTNHPAVDTRAEWSRDGKRLIFVSSRDGDREVYTMNLDGSDLTQLTFNTALDNVPIYSPDEKKILFFRLQPETLYFAIFVMNADGTGEQQLTPDALGAAEGDWSPDGKEIVFQDNTCATTTCPLPADIAVMDADGSNVRKLTQFNAGRGPISAINPRWSPDGKEITFVADAVTCDGDVCEYDPHFDVYTMNADGKRLKNLTDSSDIDDFGAVWGPKVRPKGMT